MPDLDSLVAEVSALCMANSPSTASKMAIEMAKANQWSIQSIIFPFSFSFFFFLFFFFSFFKYCVEMECGNDESRGTEKKKKKRKKKYRESILPRTRLLFLFRQKSAKALPKVPYQQIKLYRYTPPTPQHPHPSIPHPHTYIPFHTNRTISPQLPSLKET